MKISDWIEEDGFSYKYVLGTDKEDESNRVAAIEKTPRVQIIRNCNNHDGLMLSKKKEKVDIDNKYQNNEVFYGEGIWLFGIKGSDCYDEDSRKWCDQLLETIYGFKWE